MEAWRRELCHHGIKGQHWGVRRGPPYPLGVSERRTANGKAGSMPKPSATKELSAKLVENAKKFVNSDKVRKAAIIGLVGAAAVGAAYVAKKSGYFSKTRVSDLHNAVSEVRFMDYKKGDRQGRFLVFTPLSFQAMRTRHRDLAKNIDEIVFPDKKKSLLDIGMDSVEATLAISDAIGKRMRQTGESEDLRVFAKAVSEGVLDPDLTLTYYDIVGLIYDNRKILENAIQTGRDFGDLKNKEAGEVLEIVKNLAEIRG